MKKNLTQKRDLLSIRDLTAKEILDLLKVSRILKQKQKKGWLSDS